ncbi:hypothetical protein JOB18_033109 [Solea senegalensis]|uniref:Uncharacterized protein n=1 Tax=Solea senegalensis TaxID=28829 RepID=A0AAV6R5H9_SOLSE|nr:hypothetical protein JOB18_033109 [Solea senegalensis]
MTLFVAGERDGGELPEIRLPNDPLNAQALKQLLLLLLTLTTNSPRHINWKPELFDSITFPAVQREQLHLGVQTHTIKYTNCLTEDSMDQFLLHRLLTFHHRTVMVEVCEFGICQPGGFTSETAEDPNLENQTAISFLQMLENVFTSVCLCAKLSFFSI